MRQLVQITRYEKPHVWVRSLGDPSRLCCQGSCPLTLFSWRKQPAQYVLPAKKQFVPNDKAYLSAEDGTLLRVAARYYGLPLLAVVIPASLAALGGLHDLVCAGLSMGSYSLCQLWLLFRSHRIPEGEWRLTGTPE